MTHSEKDLRSITIEQLEARGVTIDDIAEVVLFLQQEYIEELTLDVCRKSVKKVLKKREILNTVLTAIQLDKLAEQNKLEYPIQDIISNDEGLYGTDETLALAIVNVYGSIGLTNFGYVDKLKPGIIGELDKGKGGHVHTFLDDIVGALAAAAASRIAHSNPNLEGILR